MDAGSVERFERFVAFTGDEDSCWHWLGSVTGSRGYGKFAYRGRSVAAHRLSYELYVGPIPIGLLVLHHCDVRDCVRPSHLFVGTQADNIADRDAKGRRNVAAAPRKLDEGKVQALVAMALAGASGAFLARAFGVSAGTVSHILSAKQWQHATAGML